MSKNLNFFYFFFIILLLFLAGCNSGPGEYDTFAKCLTEKGATMYGTEGCSYCKNQKATFGKSFDYVNYIDCDYKKSQCEEANVKGYPTWNINGINLPGEQSLPKLSRLTGCKLSPDN